MMRRGFFDAMKSLVRVRRRMRGPMRPSWDEDFETWARFLHHYGKRSTNLPLAWQRRMLGVAPRTSIVRRMRFERVRAGGVPAEWFHAPESDPKRVLLYLHGGGYSVGSIDSHRDLVSRLCVAARARRPRHRLPTRARAPVPGAARRRARSRTAGCSSAASIRRGSSSRGESAGGGLTLSTLVSLRDARDPLPAARSSISPWVDLEGDAPSMKANARYDYVCARRLRVFARRFVREADVRNPLAAPVHANLRGLPPMLVQAGGAESLLDDARRIAARPRDAGVDVTLEVEPDMIHVLPHVCGVPRAGPRSHRARGCVRSCLHERDAHPGRRRLGIGEHDSRTNWGPLRTRRFLPALAGCRRHPATLGVTFSWRAPPSQSACW